MKFNPVHIQLSLPFHTHTRICRKMRIFKRCTSSSGFLGLELSSHIQTNSPFPFLPFFNSSTSQKRWMKHVNSTQTRLENRTRDHKIDKLLTHLEKLSIVLQIKDLMSNRRRGPFVSVQSMSKWQNVVGLNVGIGLFLRKYPHVFELFTHPVRRNVCCKITSKMAELIEEEEIAIKEFELKSVDCIKKLLMMSVNCTLRVHALWLIRRELGLPDDFRDSILQKYTDEFRLIDLETVELIEREDENNLGVAEIEKWREKEYREKWLSEFDTKYAFPLNFPTGFKFERGFREMVKSWQKLPYAKPYEKMESLRVRSCGGLHRFEKRAVAILHELLSLTVEKMINVERLAHFKKCFAMEIVNVRELLLKHPGIFYISTKGNTQMVFLIEGYSKGCLIETNPIHDARRKMVDLLLLGCRNTRELHACKEAKEEDDNVVVNEELRGTNDGDWIIPILENFEEKVQ